MAYTRYTWRDGIEGGTALSDEHLNHIEDGLVALANTLDALADAIGALIAGKAATAIEKIAGGTTAARPSPTQDAVYRDHDLGRVMYGTGTQWVSPFGVAITGVSSSNAPQAFSAVTQPDNSIVCSWQPVAGATSYKLYEIQSPLGVSGATALTTTSAVRTPGTLRTYEYWVTATVAGVESAQSNHAQATLPYSTPTGQGSPAAILKIGSTGGYWSLGVGYPAGHIEYPNAQLVGGVTFPPYYVLTTAQSAVQFQVPMNGALMSTSAPYPVTELREYGTDGTTKAAWAADQGTHSIEYSFRVNHIQPNRPQVIVGRLVNAAGSEIVAIRVTGASSAALDVVAAINGFDHATKLVAGYAIGTLVKIRAALASGALSIYVNDALKISMASLSSTITTNTQTLGVGGIATPAGAILATADTTSALNITTSGTAGNPRVYDGQGHTVGAVTVSANYVTVQNYRIRPGSQYGAYLTGNYITLQNCDIKDVRISGDGDLNAITLFGDNIHILYNTAINFVTGDPGSSHTDAIQTWNTSGKRSTSNLWVIGNRFEGPLQSEGGAPIHQCIMGEGALSTDGGGGGSGVSQNWHIEGNYFRDSWNQALKFDDIDNVTITRNTFAGNSTYIVDITALSTGVKFYSDNIISGPYGSVNTALTAGAGPANPLSTTTTTTITANPAGCYYRLGAAPLSSSLAGGFESPSEYCQAELSGLTVAHNPPLGVTTDDGVQAAVLLGWGAVIDGDEFEYTGAPNSSKWSLYDGPGHDGNGIRSPAAFSVANGILTCTGDNVNGGTTGGMAFNRSQMYWRIEWRIRAYSTGGGGNPYHPVLINWPTSDVWPQDGEDDYYECDVGTGMYEAYIHIPGNDGGAQEYVSKPCDIQNWHNMAFERNRTGVKGWLDGVQVFSFTGSYIVMPGPGHPTFQLDNFFGSNMQPAKFECMWMRIYNSP